MTPTTSHVATDELIETLEKGFLIPVSPSWLHDAIRHYARNVEWDIPDDGSALDRYAGSDVATVLNHLPALISALKENQRLREYVISSQHLLDWMNGNDLVADYADAFPEEFKRQCAALEAIRAALQPQGEK